MNRRTRLGFQCALVVCATMAISQVGRAQGLYGSLTGNVTDPSGAAVPQAKVEALNVNTGIARQSDTDSRGVFLFSNVQPGFYKVTVTAKSFQTFIETNVEVQASAVRRVDLQLQVATVAQSLEVSADAVALQTDKADIHTEIRPIRRPAIRSAPSRYP
jgi:hypothetical protein